MKTQAKSSIEWDQLNLAPEVKIQVESLVESLLAQAQDKIKQLEEKNQALIYELAHLRRMRYGSKSEAMSAIQLSLLDEDYQTDVAAIETEIKQLPLPQPKKPKRVRAGRQPLSDHLPRIEHRHEPASCQCQQCGTVLTKISEDVTEQLDVEPAQILRAPPHPSTIRLPVLRNHRRRTGAARNHRRRHGSNQPLVVDHYCQIP